MISNYSEYLLLGGDIQISSQLVSANVLSDINQVFYSDSISGEISAPTNLSVRFVSRDDYHNAILSNQIEKHTIYVVSGDQLNAYNTNIVSVASPINDTDAANKEYVISAIDDKLTSYYQKSETSSAIQISNALDEKLDRGEYLSSSGGTVSGDVYILSNLSVDGQLIINGEQASVNSLNADNIFAKNISVENGLSVALSNLVDSSSLCSVQELFDNIDADASNKLDKSEGGIVSADVIISGDLNVVGEDKKLVVKDGATFEIAGTDLNLYDSNFKQTSTRFVPNPEDPSQMIELKERVYNLSPYNGFIQAEEAFRDDNKTTSRGVACTGYRGFCILQMNNSNKTIKLSGDPDTISNDIAFTFGKCGPKMGWWDYVYARGGVKDTNGISVVSVVSGDLSSCTISVDRNNTIDTSTDEDEAIRLWNNADENAFYFVPDVSKNINFEGDEIISGYFEDKRDKVCILGNANINSFNGTHVEGGSSKSIGKFSHAEGRATIAEGRYSHSEGSFCHARQIYSHVEGNMTYASGSAAHAEGKSTNAIGETSHAEGSGTYANGKVSHAEGLNTYALGSYSHAEGGATSASGSYSHVEGGNAIAKGNYSHSEGYQSLNSHFASHAEGICTSAQAIASHVEGGCLTTVWDIGYDEEKELSVALSTYNQYVNGGITKPSGIGAHAEGINSIAEGVGSHAEGGYYQLTSLSGWFLSSNGESVLTSYRIGIFPIAGGYAKGYSSHAEGRETSAIGNYSHAEGYQTLAKTSYTHAEGYKTNATGSYSHAEGYQTEALCAYSHAEGYGKATNEYAHAEGRLTEASGKYSHTEGQSTIAEGNASHAEGNSTYIATMGTASHVEGNSTSAINAYSHAEGDRTFANGQASHAEGLQTNAIGNRSHAEGYQTSAEGLASHAENGGTWAKGDYSHAEGYNVSAIGNYSHAAGNKAIANALTSYIWNGSGSQQTNDIEGSFAIWPKNGLSGFYVSGEKMSDIILSAETRIKDYVDQQIANVLSELAQRLQSN